jgi:serine/threonine-protein kinase
MAEVLPDSPEELIPTSRQLGRYTLRYRVARGGMASVFLAQLLGDAGFAKWVAVKVVHPHIATDPRFAQMFLDEARLAAQLQHPNLCTVFDFGNKDGSLFLAMEYLHGESLASVAVSAWRDGALPMELAARIVADAARGLHAAHELRREDGAHARVVHRDVSPQNLFVLYDGVTKVVDFGIARWTDRLGESTGSGTLKGKVAYMAPEQLRGGAIDRRADLWALGVVLWECLVGRRLFKRSVDAATLMAVLNEPAPAPSAHRPEVPEALDRVCLRALSRDPEGRFPTALELARSLEAWLATRGQATGSDEVGAWMQARFTERMAFRDKLLRAPTGPVQLVERWMDPTGSHRALSDVDAPEPPAPRYPGDAPERSDVQARAVVPRPPIRTTRWDRVAPWLAAFAGLLVLLVLALALGPWRGGTP